MTKIELGGIGAVVSPAAEAVTEAAIELERLGYSTIWVTGGPLNSLGQVAELVRATSTVRIATGILSVDRFEATAVDELYAELESAAPGRFVVGLGGAHGPNPVGTLTAYLEQLVSVPRSARVMAALGPRMLEFARVHASGALPVLVTPEYTATARSALGPDTTLAVEQLVVLDADPDRARATAREPLGFLGTLPAYRANFRRMGLSDDDVTQLSDRIVDALVAWGDAPTVAERIVAQRRAGADHVAVSVTTDDPDTIAVDEYRQLAEAMPH